MDLTVDRLREVLGAILEGDLVPFLSLWIIVVAAVASGFDYSILVESATLLFYAVLVGVWTSLAPTDPLEEGGNYAQLEFLMISTAAVVVGVGIEWTLGQLSGTMYAVQALALTFLGSRLYVNSLGTDSFVRMFRLHKPSERYLIYVPCLVGISIPILLYQLGFETPLGYSLQSPETVGLVAAAGLLLGGLAYGLVELAIPRLLARTA